MKTILLVEDNGELRRAVARRLSQYDVYVSQASDASSAHSALSRRDYDIVLTDYDLGEGPRTGGWLLNRIPSDSPTMKCLTSSYSRDHLLVSDPCINFFPKPLDVEHFAEVAGLKKKE